MYNVLIVDDDTLMRNALRAMISRFKNFPLRQKYASSLPTPTFILPKKQWNYISKNTFPSQYLFLI